MGGCKGFGLWPPLTPAHWQKETNQLRFQAWKCPECQVNSRRWGWTLGESELRWDRAAESTEEITPGCCELEITPPGDRPWYLTAGSARLKSTKTRSWAFDGTFLSVALWQSLERHLTTWDVWKASPDNTAFPSQWAWRWWLTDRRVPTIKNSGAFILQVVPHGKTIIDIHSRLAMNKQSHAQLEQCNWQSTVQSGGHTYANLLLLH